MNRRLALTLLLTMVIFALGLLDLNIYDRENFKALCLIKLVQAGAIAACWWVLRPDMIVVGLKKPEEASVWRWLGGVLLVLVVAGFFMFAPRTGLEWETLFNRLNMIWPLSALRWYQLVFAALLVPLVEELVFRGVCQGSFEKIMPSWAAALSVALIFFLMHGLQRFEITVFLGALGLSVLRWKTGVIWPSFVVHALGNGVLTWLTWVSVLS